jgi:cobyrinic acid a,c-diamide synthase
MFLSELEANQSLRQEIRSAVEDGMPVYAECGGLMYLCRRIRWQGKAGEMVGVFPFEVELLDKPQGHGYVSLQVDGDNPFFSPGTVLRGHEFHYSHLWGSLEGFETAYRLERGVGLGAQRDGMVYKNVLAAYTHLHCDGAPGWAAGLVNRARQFGQKCASLESGNV